MYCELQLNIPYSVGFNFVLHGKVHANYMTGVTSSHHKSSLSSISSSSEKSWYVHKHCKRRYTTQYYLTIMQTMCKNNIMKN